MEILVRQFSQLLMRFKIIQFIYIQSNLYKYIYAQIEYFAKCPAEYTEFLYESNPPFNVICSDKHCEGTINRHPRYANLCAINCVLFTRILLIFRIVEICTHFIIFFIISSSVRSVNDNKGEVSFNNFGYIKCISLT